LFEALPLRFSATFSWPPSFINNQTYKPLHTPDGKTGKMLQKAK
jgi:hypothetical protein